MARRCKGTFVGYPNFANFVLPLTTMLAIRTLTRTQLHAARSFAASVGTDIGAASVSLQKARSWDDGAADGFKKTSMQDLFAGKKVALFAVPGAFTGVCHNAHVPSYSKNAAALTGKGIDKIVCVSVNDPYTMHAWAQSVDPSGSVEFYGDSDASFTEFIGKDLDLNVAALGPGKRSHRYSMLVEDGKVTKMYEEEAPSDMKVSGGDTMLKDL
mmetsp:Transcript_44297/g.87859  ORF Transcript_44297/g.87859 Transcript_44297/m.87859 type:complete len:213 (-) Transcript_44297:151-789(-)